MHESNHPATPAVTDDCATDTLALLGADGTTAVDDTIDITTASAPENTPDRQHLDQPPDRLCGVTRTVRRP